MDKFIKIPIFLLLIIFISQSLTEKEIVQYESAEDACQKCTCLTAEDENKSKHFILSCAVKGFKYILAGWPKEFGDNHTGTEIVVSFSGNSIERLNQLPETDGSVSFSCRHCNISEIGSAIFMDVANIQSVDLSWNDIESDTLRADIFRGRFSNRDYEPINAMEDLDLSHNRIHTLERRLFEHIPHLKKLNLAYNLFDLIDMGTGSAIASAKELRHLDMSYNTLKTLPNTIFNTLTMLKELHLEGNDFKMIPGSLSLLGTSLEFLYIGANPIETITEDSFIGYKKLTYLNISGMPELTSVDVGTFAHLKTLKTVICRDNPKLVKFDVESLKQANNLRDLDLSNCALKKLNVDYEFEIAAVQNYTIFWSTLRTLRLSGNPWHCDCFMSHIVLGLIQHNNAKLYSDYKARCATPYDLAGILLEDLTVERGCQLPAMNMQIMAEPQTENHPFLRPKAIVLTIVASVVVVGIALIVGFGIVMVRRKLKQDNSIFTTPIRYTTVRNSTMSAVSVE